jgi:PAS domain S-box-containing protein
MSKGFRILHLEDSRSDAMIVEMALKKGDFQFDLLWVTNKKDYSKALLEFSPDIILSDHSLPSFSSTEALRMLQESGLSIPFILITGTVSEEFAVSIMKDGAADYLLKDRLQRLPEAIQGALRNAHAEKERLRYLEETVRNENKFRALIENIFDGIILVNHDASVIYQSPSEERITGYRYEEMRGKTIFDFIHPDDMLDAMEFYQSIYVAYGETKRSQYRIMHKDGHAVWVECTVTNKLADKNIGALVLNYHDISERKRSEEETFNLISNLKKKNSDLRQFAYIVSHNLRAPIVKIQGLAALLMDAESGEEVPKLHRYINNEVENLDQVVVDMNAIITAGESENLERERIDFEFILSLVKNVLEKDLQECDAEVSFSFDVPSIYSVKSYIYSIVYNLMSNAVKYRTKGCALKVHVSTRDDSGCICLKVKDNGMGIDLERHKDQLFGLYKRFNGRDIEGRGVGLNMVKAQVESLGGKIEVESMLNKGTVFSVYFPR